MILKKHYNKTKYQGPKRLKPKNYFEGWYFKQVSEDQKHTISFIPGISLNKENPHSFVQCIYRDPSEGLHTYYFQYDLDAFSYNHDPFEIRVGDNLFTKEGILIKLDNDFTSIKAEFQYSGLTDIKRTPMMPNIMGLFSFIPNMECNHEVVSMDHHAYGEMIIADETIDWGNGKGYIEKDWGRSFPKDYLWVQSNNFERDHVGFVCSIARIPFMGLAFKGFFCNVVVDGMEYRFATYNGSRLRVVRTTKDYFDVIMIRKGVRLRLKGKIKQSGSLKSPFEGAMTATIKEGLSGEIKVVMKDRDHQVILASKSYTCGIEIEV